MRGWGGCRSHPPPTPHHIRHRGLVPWHSAPQFRGCQFWGGHQQGWSPYSAAGKDSPRPGVGLRCLPMGMGLGNALRDLLAVFGERVWDP